jgi:hypothetical protein
MNVLTRWRRSAIALALASAAVALAPTAATAATSPHHTQAAYLQRALGLPATDTDPAIESVTYDHFQWLLQQSGNFAFLIGDPVLDPSFRARAQDVEAAAKAAGAKKVYWFDPNLSGSVTVGNTPVPNLDIRNPDGITSLVAGSRTTYGRVWLSLIGQYLGNGIKSTPGTTDDDKPGAEDATVSSVPDASVVNDVGRTTGYSTEVGDTSGGALYDYAGGTAPADARDSFFFLYNKEKTVTPDGAPAPVPAKIVSWVNLTDETQSVATRAKVTTAIATAGAGNLAELDQFDWWKSEVNFRQPIQSPQVNRGSGVPVLTEADDAAKWRINQITYPELVDLLEHSTDANEAILFGGTWCPNTRPVLGAVNKYAQEHDITVFNFDTVLDGANVGGGATSASNPLQSRNYLGSSVTATAQTTPSFLYGEVLSRYLTNIQTQYVPTSNSVVTYYPGGDTAGTLTKVKKLQVPFLIGYQGKAGVAPNAGVTRQWIINKGDGTYTEYMSQWWLTNPQPYQLALSATQLPQTAPYWQTLNAQVASYKWDTNLSTVLPNTGIDTDDGPYLTPTDTATVTFNGAGTDVSAASGGANPIPVNGDKLAQALAALGTSAPINLVAAKAALLAAKAAGQDVTDLSTVFAAYTLANPRKRAVFNAWGSPTAPGTIAGGIAAVHALDVFFDGLPRGVVSRRTVTANTVKFPAAATISLAIANDYDRVPAGNVSLVVKQAGATVASASTAVANNAASFTLGVLDAGTYDYTLTYPGDDQLAAFTETGPLTVAPADPVVVDPTPTPTPVVISSPGPKPPAVTLIKAGKVKGAVTKAPTSKKAGTYKVTIAGASTATGKVTLKLKKGKVTKTITGKLSKGAVTFSVPKLAKGTWKVTISWPGDSKYQAASATGTSIKVKK